MTVSSESPAAAGAAPPSPGPLAQGAPQVFAHLSPLARRAAPGPSGASHGAAPVSGHSEARLAPFLDLPGEDLILAAAAPPALGLIEARERWRAWQRRGVGIELPSTLPVVTSGLSHALALLADLFAAPGTPVALAGPFWGNYRQAFGVRRGATILSAPAYLEGRYNSGFAQQALREVPAGVPAVVVLNAPSNPGGYSPTGGERKATVESLAAEAARRPLLVICDDAYAGLVFEPEIPSTSTFWELVELSQTLPSLTAVKVDGATKEFSFFGGRVGFVSFGLPIGSPMARDLEARLALLIRTGVGSAAAASQVLLLQALRQEAIAEQVEEVRQLLERRYRALRPALEKADPELLTVLPFNSGCFALVELPEALGVDSETARKHLLAEHGTGLISLAPRYLRIAHCSVAEEALPELAERLQKGVAELAGR